MKLKIILIPILIILFNFQLLALDYNFYQKEFQKYDVYKQFSKEQADSATKEMIDYLNDKGALQTDFFNSKEKSHLNDVKIIFSRISFLLYLFFILFFAYLLYLFYKKDYPSLSNLLIRGGTFTLILILILSILAYFDFFRIFIKIHFLLFNNLNWVLDPTKDNLILLFPLGFFFDITFRILLSSIFNSLFFIALGNAIKPRRS